ncbi:MAG TPA: hypothetical protein VIW03_11830 [Anaeromyxobacter sp.]
MPRLAVTGHAAITAVGGGVAAAAAIRAGISRPAPVPANHSDPEELDDAPLTGYPLVGVADGFEGPGLVVTLGSQALRDLVRVARPPSPADAFFTSSALYVGMSPCRSEDADFMTEVLRDQVPGRIARAAGVQTAPQSTFGIMDGHASVAVALADAQLAIEQRRFVRALVVGVDSLAKRTDLAWLSAKHRLKNPDNPAGLEPGEGAGAILVEAEDEARRRGAKVLAWLESVKIAQEPETRAEGKRGTGRGLAEAIRGALGSRKTVGTVFADLNGEDARAFEWGTAVARLARTHDLPASPEAIATSIGDTGAASGAIQLVCATQALVRGYARGDACLVCSSADSGKVGAALLVAAGAEERR